MKKVFSFFITILLVVIISGCDYKKENKESSNSNIKEVKEIKKVEDYKVKIEDNTKKINDSVSATYTNVIVTHSKKDKESDKINQYLADKVNVFLNEYVETIKEEFSNELTYLFDFKYSLEQQTDSYIIFKLTYYYQIGGPYPMDATIYYIFNKDTGDIVEFDDLFTEDIKDKVYDSVLKYLKKIYKESEIEYLDDDYDLKDNMFKEGYYLLKDNKLSFHFPRSEFAAAAFGSININIDESIYSSYIKDTK